MLYAKLVCTLLFVVWASSTDAEVDVRSLSTEELKNEFYTNPGLSNQREEAIKEELAVRYAESGYSKDDSGALEVSQLKPEGLLPEHERDASTPGIDGDLLDVHGIRDPSKNVQDREGLVARLEESDLEGREFFELINELRVAIHHKNPLKTELDALIQLQSATGETCESLLGRAAHHTFGEIRSVRKYIDHHIEPVLERCALKAQKDLFEAVVRDSPGQNYANITSLYDLMQQFRQFKFHSLAERKALLFLKHGYNKFQQDAQCVRSLVELYEAQEENSAATGMIIESINHLIEQNLRACRVLLNQNLARNLDNLGVSTLLRPLYFKLSQVDAHSLEPELIKYLISLARKKKNFLTSHRKYITNLKSLLLAMVSYPCKLVSLYFESFSRIKAKLNRGLPMDILSGVTHHYVDLCRKLTPLLPQVEADLEKIDKSEVGVLDYFRLIKLAML